MDRRLFLRADDPDPSRPAAGPARRNRAAAEWRSWGMAAGSVLVPSLAQALRSAAAGAGHRGAAIAVLVAVCARPSYRFLSLAISTGITRSRSMVCASCSARPASCRSATRRLMGVGAYAAAILAARLRRRLLVGAAVRDALASAVFAGILGCRRCASAATTSSSSPSPSAQLLAIVLTNGGDFTGAATGLDVAGPVSPCSAPT